MFAFLDTKVLFNMGSTKRKEFAPRGANTFLLKLTPFNREAKMKKMLELHPWKVYSFILSLFTCQYFECLFPFCKNKKIDEIFMSMFTQRCFIDVCPLSYYQVHSVDMTSSI